MRYFELFSLPVSYQIDTEKLNAQYLELQRVAHPDKHTNSTERERLLAVQKSAEINDALHTLKHPVKRAEYMLAQLGVDIRAEQQTLQDNAFLIQQMELREALEEISHSDSPESQIDELEQQIKQLKQHYGEQLTPQLASGDQSDWQQAADNVRKLKFVYKLQDELSRIEDALFD